MLRYLTVFVCFLGAGAALAEDRWSLSGEAWARPRSGAGLVAMEPLGEVVRHLQENDEQRLFIGHPGGEEGSLWAHELRSWLVALGIPSRRIQLQSGSRQAGVLELRVQDSPIP
jgi:hypothetical protein